MIAWLDRAALTLMALGAATILQPLWAGGFRAGFFVTFAATALHIITSHLRRADTP
jgi:hypothetical protein